MQISSIEDHPQMPNAANVRFEDGTSMTVPRERLAQLQLGASGATAQNMSIDPSGDQPRASFGPSDPQEFGAKWGGPPPQQGQEFVPAQPGPAPRTAAPPPTMASMATPQTQAIGIVPRLAFDGPPMPALDPRQQEVQSLRSPYKRIAGTAAFDPIREARLRSPVPVSQTIQTSGARAYDPAAVEDYQDKERKAADYQAESAMLQARSKLEADQLMSTEVSSMFAQQKAKQQADETEFAAKQTELNNEARAVANREVDPNRIFKNMSVWQTLGLTIAAGLKGYASQGRDNSVMDSLLHRMDADIQAQETDIRNARGSVDNALSRQAQKFGSIQAGKSALRDMGLEALRLRTLAAGSEIGTAIAKSNSDALAQRLEAQQAKEREQRWSEAQGQTAVSAQAAMMSPRKGTAGGLALKTEAERLKGWEAADKLDENAATTAGKQLSNLEKRGELTGAIPGKATEHIATQTAAYGAKLGANEGAQVAFDRFIGENGIKMGKDGNLKPPSDIAGFGWWNSMTPESWQTQKGVDNRAALRKVVYAQVLSAFGAANDKQIDMITDKVIGNGTKTHITAELNQMGQDLKAQRDNIHSSFSPQIRANYKSNKGTVRAEQDTKASAWQPVDFTSEGPKGPR